MPAPRPPGVQPSRAGGPGPSIPVVRWGRDALIRRTKKLVESIIRAYRGDFSFIYIMDTDPCPLEYGVLSQELAWTNLKAYATLNGVEVAALLNLGKGPLLGENGISLPRNDSEQIAINEKTSAEAVIVITRQGVNDYLIKGNIDGSLKELEHIVGSQSKVDTHAADTSTHGVTTIDGVTERNTAISNHGLDTSTHGAEEVADVATVSAEIDSDISTHAADTSTHGVATVADAADLDDHVVDTSTHGVAIVADDTGIGARVYNSGNISIPNNTLTPVTFNSETYDTDTIHSTASNTSRLTCKTAGTYEISGHVTFDAVFSDTTYEVYLRLNGTTNIAAQNRFAGLFESFSISTLYNLSVNDYVELAVKQVSGGASNVLSAFPLAFAMQRIST